MEPQQEEWRKIETWVKGHEITLGQVTNAILDQEISKYPIFVFSSASLPVGVYLTAANVDADHWSVYASTLEEFASRQIIQSEKVDGFRQVYKDPDQYFCLFLLQDNTGNFIFLPRRDKALSN